MATVRPTQLFTGYTSDGTNITIPIASIQNLTAAKADAATGNAADVLWGLISTAQSADSALAPEAKSSTYTIAKGNQATVTGNPEARSQPFTFTVRLQPTGLQVIPEA